MKRTHRLLALAGVLVSSTLAIEGGSNPAGAAQTCTVSCSTATLTCNTSTTCTSSPGSMICCGQTYTCSAIDTYNNCRSTCLAEYNACRLGCPSKLSPCFDECVAERHACETSCNPRPPTTVSC